MVEFRCVEGKFNDKPGGGVGNAMVSGGNVVLVSGGNVVLPCSVYEELL